MLVGTQASFPTQRAKRGLRGGGGGNTSEGLLQLVPIGSAFQETPQGDDDVLIAGPLAGVFMPAVLHELQVVLNTWQGLTREGLQGGQLWPRMLLSQHHHDLHRHCHCYSKWREGIVSPYRSQFAVIWSICRNLANLQQFADRQNCLI